VIVGEGTLEETVRADFGARNLTAHFFGYRPYPEMLAILRRCEFLLFPSVWPEPLGRVLIEAGMCRKAAIALDRPGGHLDIIRHGETGLLADSAQTFADMILQGPRTKKRSAKKQFWSGFCTFTAAPLPRDPARTPTKLTLQV